jgi:O-antigen/teichoic acid export membrane protein
MKAAGNVVWNWTGMAVNMLAGFIVAPYLVHQLGDAGYGLWILIASMTGYFGLLDLGVRGSVGRYIAFYRARGEQEGVNQVLSTAVAILLGVGVLALIATAAAVPLFHRLFDVPIEQQNAATWAIIIVGINLALTFPVSVFDGVLWGHERFDLLNMIDIPTAIIRTALSFLLVHGPEDLTSLALLTLGTTLANELAKVYLSFRISPGLRVNRLHVRKQSAAQLYGYGLWHFLLSVSRQVNLQVAPLLVGSLLTVAVVTPFSIAARLIGYAGQFIVSATGVFTPVATALHAKEEHAGQKKLFITGGQWCTAFALYMCILLVLLGRPLMALWIDPDMATGAILLLVILTAGEFLPISQWLTYSMILGMAKHRLSAIVNLAEGLVAVVAAILLVRPMGVVGVCIAFAVAGFICRGVFQVVYGCYLIKVPLSQYLVEAMLRPVLAAVIPTALLYAAVTLHQPATWMTLILYTAAFSMVFIMTSYWALGLASYLPADRFLRPRGRALEGANVHS